MGANNVVTLGVKVEVIDNIRSGISSMQQQLEKGFSGVKIPDTFNKDMSSKLKRLNTDVDEFVKRTQNGFTKMGDFTKANTSLENLQARFNLLSETFKTVQLNPEKLLPKETVDLVNKLQTAFTNAKNSVDDFHVATAKKDAQQAVDDMTKKVAELKTAWDEAKTAKEQASANVTKKNTDLETKRTELNNLKTAYSDLLNKQKELQKQEQVKSNLQEKYNKYKIAMIDYSEAIRKASEAYNALSKEEKKGEKGQEYQKIISDTTANKAEEEKKAIAGGYDTQKNVDKSTAELDANTAAIKKNESQRKALSAEIARGEKQTEKFTTKFSEATKKEEEANRAYTESNEKLKGLREALNSIGTTTEAGAITKLKDEFGKLGISLDQLSKVEKLEDFEAIINSVKDKDLSPIKNSLEAMGLKLQEVDGSLKVVKAGMEEAGAATKQMDDRMRDIESLKSRIAYFFGLNNAINLARRALRKTYETIKELDEAMTETAVVTDFSVGDMWEQLPRYTQAANELGATTLGAYETMTLFYQQGLDTNEAFEIGTETMKMARIAGLEYADATDLNTLGH